MTFQTGDNSIDGAKDQWGEGRRHLPENRDGLMD